EDSECTAPVIPGETSGSCEFPVPQMRLCSTGTNNGAPCATSADCPDGACVLTEGVCDGGANDGFTCLSNGGCNAPVCVPAAKVCDSGDFFGVACLHDAQCGALSLCIESGRACVGGPFDGFACVEDVNCFDPESDVLDPGACEGVVPRQCSI